MEILEAAMKAVIQLDHSEKRAQAVKYPSRNEMPKFFVPGAQVLFYSDAEKKNRKGSPVFVSTSNATSIS